VPTENSSAQRIEKNQRKNEYLKKKKLTSKEIEKAIGGLNNNDQYLNNKMLQMNYLWGLYLEFRKEVFKEDTEEFNKFVTEKLDKVKEFEQQRSENKERA